MSKGVSPFISYALIILLAIAAVGVVTTVGLPTLRQSQESVAFDIALNNLQQIDSLIREVASEGQGSLRAVQVSVSGGKYFVTNGTSSLVFTYDTTRPFIPNATNVTRGNIRIVAGYRTGNMTLQYDKVNITGALSIQNGNYKICVENTGVVSGKTVVNVRVC